MNHSKIRSQVMKAVLAFVILLALSGITAFPLQWELNSFAPYAHHLPTFAQTWFDKIHAALLHNGEHYPYLAYGTDWLAFAHIVIAVAFYGPYRDPVKNIWVIQFGMIACLMVFPLAFIAGHFRGIPMFWRLIDCSFGVGGLILLSWIYAKIKILERGQFQEADAIKS